MSSPTQSGQIGWIDMTTMNAAEVRDFYQAVAGWESEDMQMEGCADFVMKPRRRDDLVTRRNVYVGI